MSEFGVEKDDLVYIWVEKVSSGAGLTYAVQPVNGHRLEGPPHHGVLLQHLVEVIHGQGEESTVSVGAHARRSPALGEQTDLCAAGTQKEDKGLRARKTGEIKEIITATAVTD